MRHEIVYTPSAIEQLRGLPARRRREVLDAVDEQLANEPAQATRHRKPMRPNSLAAWELRVGDLRVFYDIEPAGEGESVPRVVVLAVGEKVGNRFRIGGEEVEL